MSIKSVSSKTCVWCVAAAIIALALLAVTWTVILASNTSVSGMIQTIFPD